MANIEKHALGSFCWVELATTDQTAAKAFYGGLFGWQANDMPLGPDDSYSIFQLEGRDAAAAYTLRPEQHSRGVPPNWMLYVAVQSADAAAERTAQLGGTVLASAFDVFDTGRMAVLQDPAGANFSVWQSKKNIGIGITGVEGTLCWADLSTPDRERVSAFYAELFGWTIRKEDEAPEHAYWHLANGEEFIGGILPATHRDPNAPPHWQVYFAVNDCDGSAVKARALGARLFLPPMTFEDIGRMAVMADPQGSVFAIFQTAGRT